MSKTKEELRVDVQRLRVDLKDAKEELARLDEMFQEVCGERDELKRNRVVFESNAGQKAPPSVIRWIKKCYQENRLVGGVDLVLVALGEETPESCLDVFLEAECAVEEKTGA